jgi:hypothetical protein
VRPSEADCLRNAVNSFVYSDPLNLPQMAPASQLSSEPHSLSRLFTGAFFEALASLLTATARKPADPQPNELATVVKRMATLLVHAVSAAPVVSNFYAQVAGELVAAATQAEAAVLRAVFVRRSILSLHSAMQVANLYGASEAPTVAAAAMAATTATDLGVVAIDARHYGLDKSLHLESPGQARRFEVWAGAPDGGSIEPSSALVAARSFADDTIRRGRVLFSKEAHSKPKLHAPGHFHTHHIVADGGNAFKLQRVCFDCGLHWR